MNLLETAKKIRDIQIEILKKEKQREIAIKDILTNDNDYITLDVKINTNNVFIAICQKEKAELNIELNYQKNILRIAEIEAMKKVGV